MSCVVIGGGAAGIFAAIRYKEKNPQKKVIVLEKSNQLLSKVRISGGGRCNVTHACFDPAKLIQNYPRGSKELLGPFHLFGPSDTMKWFADRGVVLKVEEDGRVFPNTDSSETIINCLLEAAKDVEIRKVQHILSAVKEREGFLIELSAGSISADCLILATGSSSFGHDLARKFGHTIIQPVPSLFTFNVPSSPLLDLSGISVPHAIVTLKEVKLSQQGPFLLTHWGFSGPAVLKLSAFSARLLHDLGYKATLLVNWIGAKNQQEIYETFLQRKKQAPLQAMPSLLPKQLWNRLVGALGLDPAIPIGRWPNASLLKIASKLYADPYLIEGKTTYKQEFVTAGGVALKEIDTKTMQSRIVPGLFFAGEILDVDGVTGGFNFQNAWTTAWIAGSTAGAQ